jgi:hypothetical protein
MIYNQTTMIMMHTGKQKPKYSMAAYSLLIYDFRDDSLNLDKHVRPNETLNESAKILGKLMIRRQEDG